MEAGRLRLPPPHHLSTPPPRLAAIKDHQQGRQDGETSQSTKKYAATCNPAEFRDGTTAEAFYQAFGTLSYGLAILTIVIGLPANPPNVLRAKVNQPEPAGGQSEPPATGPIVEPPAQD